MWTLFQIEGFDHKLLSAPKEINDFMCSAER